MTIKNPYGLKDGMLTHVSEVHSGLKCGCVCPACKSPLVARKGSRNVHHFAHYENTECAGNVETTLHLLTKDILSKEKNIVLPEMHLNLRSGGKSWEFFGEKTIHYDKVVLETRIDDIVPDVVVYSDGRPLLIEICVTHFVSPEKTEKIKKLGISAIEIVLDDMDKDLFNVEELRKKLLFETINKEWIYNVKAAEAENFVAANLETFIVKRKVNHFDRVYGCPLHCRLTRYRKVPYALTIDCCYCEYNLSGKTKLFCKLSKEDRDGLDLGELDYFNGALNMFHRAEHVLCAGWSKVASYQEFLAYQQKHRGLDGTGA